MLTTRLISTNKKVHTGLVIAIVALSIVISPNVYAQSPLTLQPSTGRVGVGNTNPAETLDVTGNIKSSGTLNATGNITTSGSLSVGTTAQTGTANRFRYRNSMARALHSTDSTISTGTWTVVSWNTDDINTDGMHSTTTNNTRLTAAITGKYYYTFNAFFGGSNVGTRYVAVDKNAGGALFGSTTPIHSFQGGFVANSLGYAAGLVISDTVSLSAGDYIEAFVWQDSGGNLALIQTGIWRSSFEMHFIGE